MEFEYIEVVMGLIEFDNFNFFERGEVLVVGMCEFISILLSFFIIFINV